MVNKKTICGTCLLVVFSMLFSVYMVYFNKGPPEEILASNKRRGDAKRSDITELDKENEMFQESLEKWDTFMKEHKYVSVGDIYSSCEPGDRVLVGKTALMKDGRGGLKSKTWINFTLEDSLTDGEFSIDVKYNNKNLYDNKWDLCTLDENRKDRMIFCPYKPGSYSWVKEKRIPGLLPKGQYVTKAIITNQEEQVIMCGYSELNL